MSAVDVHGHVTSPELFSRFPMPPSLADIDGMIEQKAAAGIAMSVVGSPVGAGTMVPAPGVDNWAQPLDGLERFHDWVAETVRDHPDALRAYVYTHPLGGDAYIEQAARRLEQPEFVGVIVPTGVRGRYLDDAAAEPLFALAAERDVPILLHAPADPVGAGELNHAGLVEHVARPADVTIGAAAIAMAPWLDRYPRLRLIVTGAGAGLPLLTAKLALAERRGAAWRPGPPTTPEGSVLERLRRFYVDTTTPDPTALRAALDTWGADRVLFGTDSPPLAEPHGDAVARVEALDLPERDRRAVLGDTARALFGLTVPVTHRLEETG